MRQPPPGGRHGLINEQYRIPKPHSLRELPCYLKKVFISFATRLFYIYRLVWDTNKPLLFVMLFFAIINGIFPLLGAYITAELLNALAKAALGEITSFSELLVLLVAQCAFLLCQSLLSRVYQMILRLSGERVTDHIKRMIMEKSKSIDIARYDSPEFYAKLDNANREAGGRPLEILRASFTVFSTLISMISFVVILSGISWWSPLLIVMSAIPSAVVSYIYRRKNVDYMFHHAGTRREMNYYSTVITDREHVKEIRLFGAADELIRRYKKAFSKYYAGLRGLVLHEGFWHMLCVTVSACTNCFILIFVAQRVFYGDLQVGDYSLYTGAVNTISSGIATLITTTATIYEGTLFINNLMSYMDEKSSVVPQLSPGMTPKAGGHTIELIDVSFRYPGSDKDVLSHVNLTLNAGETVVLVGLNGAGKTTLIKLITRLYDPTGGKILLDGVDLKSYDTGRLYEMFGIIFQDFGKYAMTVSENIAFGNMHTPPDPEKVRTAAARSDATLYIEKLPRGYDTPLTRWFEDDGTDLSLGQWQKLAVARAFFHDADILILDEPTASLDPLAEQEIFSQFDRLRRGKTSIFVSHRLSSATTADKIVVLEQGKVLEQGTHAELMQRDGRYKELFSTQAKRYTAPQNTKER